MQIERNVYLRKEGKVFTLMVDDKEASCVFADKPCSSECSFFNADFSDPTNVEWINDKAFVMMETYFTSCLRGLTLEMIEFTDHEEADNLFADSPFHENIIPTLEEMTQPQKDAINYLDEYVMADTLESFDIIHIYNEGFPGSLKKEPDSLVAKVVAYNRKTMTRAILGEFCSINTFATQPFINKVFADGSFLILFAKPVYVLSVEAQGTLKLEALKEEDDA